MYARVQQVLGELELLRYEMGKPKTDLLAIKVFSATPWELYFQALTMFRKANRLSFEQTRKRTEEPFLPPGYITPAHVIKLVNGSLEKIRNVKKKLGIPETTGQTPLDETQKPEDVFESIIFANRQLNLLLDLRFSPSDVYRQATQAIGYASRLLEQFSDVGKTIPDPPPLLSAVGVRRMYTYDSWSAWNLSWKLPNTQKLRSAGLILAKSIWRR